ncbi:MAG: radical SAM protein [Bdellovibrionales bacterium]|nr:radical SAM protein [Bdellovibrionales bacterium]
MKPICIAPFVGFDWRGNKGFDKKFEGSYRPCCDAQYHDDISPLYLVEEFKSVQDIMQNPLAQEIRKSLLSGEFHTVCRGCERLSKQGLKSPKDKYNKLLDQIDEPLEWSVEKGTESENIYLLDYRSSNLCNFKCRMCTPSNSNLIAKEEGVGEWHYDDTRKVSEMVDHIPLDKLVLLKFAGGEPLIMDEPLKLLEKLGDLPNLTVVVLTNLSKLSERALNALKSAKVKRIHLQISIDGTGDTYEYIRTGGVWSNLLKNLEIVRNLESHSEISMGVTFVAQLWNAYNIPDFARWFLEVESKLIGNPHSYYPKIHILHVIQPYLQLGNLNADDLKMIRNQLIEVFDGQSEENLDLMLKPLLKFLVEREDKKLQEFSRVTALLDERRQTSLLSLDSEYTRYL